jgi:hypothetical protein
VDAWASTKLQSTWAFLERIFTFKLPIVLSIDRLIRWYQSFCLASLLKIYLRLRLKDLKIL